MIFLKNYRSAIPDCAIIERKRMETLENGQSRTCDVSTKDGVSLWNPADFLEL